MAILINGRNISRQYENAGLNLHLLKEKLELDKNYFLHIAEDIKKQYVELVKDYTSGLINRDTYMVYLKIIGEFMMKINDPIDLKLYPEIQIEVDNQKNN